MGEAIDDDCDGPAAPTLERVDLVVETALPEDTPAFELTTVVVGALPRPLGRLIVALMADWMARKLEGIGAIAAL